MICNACGLNDANVGKWCRHCCETALTVEEFAIPEDARAILDALPPTPREQRIAIERMRREGGRIMGGARKRIPRDAKAAAVAEKARRVRLYASQWAEREEITYLPFVPPGVAALADRAVRHAESIG